MRKLLAVLVLGIAAVVPAVVVSQPASALAAGVWDNFGGSGTIPLHAHAHNVPLTIVSSLNPQSWDTGYNCTFRTVHGIANSSVCEMRLNGLSPPECANFVPGNPVGADTRIYLDSCVVNDSNELWFFASNGPLGQYYIDNIEADHLGLNGGYNYLEAQNDVLQCDGGDTGETVYAGYFSSTCAGDQWLLVGG